MTAPAVSLTTPEIDAVDCARTSAGPSTMSSARIPGIPHPLAARNIMFLPQASGRMPVPPSEISKTCKPNQRGVYVRW